MKISLGLTTSMPIGKSRKYAEIADKIGLYRVLVGEDILSREVFTYLTIVALQTQRVKLATGITSPYVRNIAVIASNSIGLQRITGNRFDLGLGPGGIPEVERFTGQKPKRAVAVLKETTLLLKKIFNGETVRYSGVEAKLEGFRLNVKGVTPPKIYFGVRGEKLLSLAGRISDGVILSGPKDYLLRAKKIVNEATAKAGRKEDEVDKLIWNCFVNVKSEKDVGLAKLVVATIASSLPEKEVERQDSADEIVRIKNAFGYIWGSLGIVGLIGLPVGKAMTGFTSGAVQRTFKRPFLSVILGYVPECLFTIWLFVFIVPFMTPIPAEFVLIIAMGIVGKAWIEILFMAFLMETIFLSRGIVSMLKTIFTEWDYTPLTEM